MKLNFDIIIFDILKFLDQENDIKRVFKVLLFNKKFQMYPKYEKQLKKYLLEIRLNKSIKLKLDQINILYTVNNFPKLHPIIHQTFRKGHNENEFYTKNELFGFNDNGFYVKNELSENTFKVHMFNNAGVDGLIMLSLCSKINLKWEYTFNYSKIYYYEIEKFKKLSFQLTIYSIIFKETVNVKFENNDNSINSEIKGVEYIHFKGGLEVPNLNIYVENYTLPYFEVLSVIFSFDAKNLFNNFYSHVNINPNIFNSENLIIF